MSMKLTTRAQEALSSAVQMASAAGNPSVEPLHLLEALLEQPEGIAISLLASAGVKRGEIGAQVSTALVALPASSGASVAQPQTSRALMNVITAAEKSAQERGDQYVSTEQLLIALAASDTEAGKILRGDGATPEVLEEHLSQLRPEPISTADP